MTDQDRAARLAALRAARGQAPAPSVPASTPASSAAVDPAPLAALEPTPTAPVPGTGARPAARTRRPSVAAGAKILTTGLVASSTLGLTTVIAAANRPAFTPVAESAPTTTLVAPTTVLAPVTTVPGAIVTPTVVPGAVPGQPETVVLTLPPIGVAPTATPQQGQPTSPTPTAAPAASPSPTNAPTPTAAPAPPATVAPPTTVPAPPTTTRPSR